MPYGELQQRREALALTLRGGQRSRYPSLESFARGSLAAGWNRLAGQLGDERLRVSADGVAELHVRTSRERLTARERAIVEDKFAKAVAWIGQSLVRSPDADTPGRLHPNYLKQFPVFTRASGFGEVVLVAANESRFEIFEAEPTQTERAMARLTELLPSSDYDTTMTRKLNGLRGSEIRAVREIAQIVQPLAAINVELRGRGDDLGAVLTVNQADELKTYLDVTSEQVRRLPPLEGVLDGVRFSRGLVFVNGHGGKDYEAVVDSRRIQDVERLLGHRVVASLEEVRKVRADGRLSSPAYRLTGVERADGLFDGEDFPAF
ncbi:MAG: hypothetical protein VX494_04085 [Actinomycetota bacterium]|nr:hypothetical protein [Actinomycetota bacterium]